MPSLNSIPLRGLAAFPHGYLLPWPMPRRSQSLMVRSHPAVARHRPSGENATPRAWGACARRVTSSLACGNPQSRTVPSAAAEATTRLYHINPGSVTVQNF